MCVLCWVYFSILFYLKMLKIFGFIFLLIPLAGCIATFKNHKGESYPLNIRTFLQNNPAPTVLISHGSSCLIPQSFDWAQQVRQWGYNAVVIDHCTARGVTSYLGGVPPKNLSAIDKAKDFGVIAEWVKEQKWHQGNVGVIGFSRGGAGVLMYSNSEILRASNENVLKSVDFGIAFYPGCTPYVPPKNPSIPILIHHGMSDNLALPLMCGYPALSDANYTINLYEGAYHTFDVNSTDIVVSRPQGNFVARRYNRDADIKSRESTMKFMEFFAKSR